MKYVVYIVILFTTLTVTAAERQMLTTLEAYNRMQDQMLTYRSAGERQNLTTQELLVQTPEAQPQRQMLSTLNAYHNSLAWQMGGQSSYPMVTQPQAQSPQWYDYPSQRMYAAPIMYQQPMYAEMYPPQSSQSVAAWLFGTPRQPSAPMNVTEAYSEQAEPTPQPVVTEATQPAITQPAIMQASVIAPAISDQPRPVEMRETAADALPELTLLDLAAYWTRKIVMTGLLLIIIGFAYHKKQTAEHTASRRIAVLEDELKRLDRLIYGTEHRGGNAP